MSAARSEPAAELVLGAVLAGGRSSRFGRDKALATLDGETLLARAIAALARQCAAVVVAGRAPDAVPAPARAVADWPAPDMGPLGGIAGALRHARDRGCVAVLTCGVDSLGLPPDLRARLAPGPACVAGQPVVGLWPLAALAPLEAILTGGGRHSLRALAEAVDARGVTLPRPLANINTPGDLDAFAPNSQFHPR